MGNNPVNMVDPDGRDIYTINTETKEIEVERNNDNTNSYYITKSTENGNETVFVTTMEKNGNNLMQLNDFSFDNDDLDIHIGFTMNSQGTTDDDYISGEAFGSLIGALAEDNTNDLTVTRFSEANGASPPPSVSHVNGRNGDLRLLSVNQNGERILVNDATYDIERQNNFNDALNLWGWRDLISENDNNGHRAEYAASANERGIPTDHSNHLHLQGYNPPLVTITAQEIQQNNNIAQQSQTGQ
jgi:hypothetical protein